MGPSSLIEAVRRHLGGGQALEPGVLRRALAGRLTDSRKRRGLRHELGPAVSVLVAGAACGHGSPLAVAQAAEGWDQELLAAHGCRVHPVTGRRVAPSARTLYRIPAMLDADEFEAALAGALADAALDPAVPAAYAGARACLIICVSGGRSRSGRSGSRRPRNPSGRKGRTAGSGRTRSTPGSTPPYAGIPGTFPRAGASPSTARSARAPRPAGRRRCTCSPRSPIPPAS